MRTTSLLAARKRRNLSAEQLAKLVGVDRVTIWRLETGASSPLYETAKKLEKALGCALRFDRQPRRAA